MAKGVFGVRKGTYNKVLEKFEKEGSQFDVEKLKNLYSKDVNEKIEFGSASVCNIIKRKDWDESVEVELKGLGLNYTSEFVKMVLEKLKKDPSKGLLFFRWVQESGLFKHDQGTYNAMLVALCRWDCFDEIRNLVDEMRNVGFELEMKTYCKVSKRFIKNRMMEDAVRLSEYAMDEANKPCRGHFIRLLKKILVDKELGMELFSRVVKKFSESGLFEHDQGIYNAMAFALGRRDCLDRFWILVDDMRNLGF